MQLPSFSEMSVIYTLDKGGPPNGSRHKPDIKCAELSTFSVEKIHRGVLQPFPLPFFTRYVAMSRYVRILAL